MKRQRSTDKSGSHLIGGIVVLTIGVLFLFRNFDILGPNLSQYIFSWKTLLIGIGILNLALSKNRIAGFILIAIGTFFWLPDILDLTVRASQLFWPIIIIAVGFMLLFKKPNDKHPPHPWKRKPHHDDSNTKTDNESNGDNKQNTSFKDTEYVDDVAIFSGSTKVINSNNFRGGRMTAIFGGSELNLTRARLAPGRNVLDVFFMFGGSEIIVPSDWNIVLEATPIFGGFSDERYVSQQMQTDEDTESVLIIRGLVIFGGAEIKSY